MVNYNLGKIYKIVCNITSLIYIGSTCEPTLAKRLAKHISNYNDWKNGRNKGYISSYKIFGGGNYDIILIESFPCENKDQLHARERFYIENNECVNMVIVGRKPKEYRNLPEKREIRNQYLIDNKEKIKKQQADYYENNKEKIKENVKKYRETHQITEKKKEYLKQYRQQNKEKLRLYEKERREKKDLLKLEKEFEEMLNI